MPSCTVLFFNMIDINTFSVGIKRSFVHALVYSFSQCIMFFAYAAAFTYGTYLIQYDGMLFENVFRYVWFMIWEGDLSNLTPNLSDTSYWILYSNRVLN